MTTKATQGGAVGSSIPRLEGRSKVAGRAEYVHNLRLPGMLYGKIFRSTIAHGRIRRIDVAAARAVPGVHRVVTGQDIRAVIPEPYYGPAFHDQPILALDKVRYAGEPVAVVLASDPHVAEEAAGRIVAEYEELPAVYDEVEAMTSKAVVHEVLKPAGTFPDLKHLQGRKDTNLALDFHHICFAQTRGLKRGLHGTGKLFEADHFFFGQDVALCREFQRQRPGFCTVRHLELCLVLNRRPPDLLLERARRGGRELLRDRLENLLWHFGFGNRGVFLCGREAAEGRAASPAGANPGHGPAGAGSVSAVHVAGR